MSNEIDRVLSDFILESRENLERLDHEFVALETDPDNKELLGSIFRTIHTIKGSAGFLSLANLEQVSHYAEDVLAKLRERSLKLNADIITILLSAVDCIKAILLNLEKTGEEGKHDVLEVAMKLMNITEEPPIQQPENGPAKESDEAESDASKQEEALTSPSTENDKRTRENSTKAQKISETVERALSSVEETRIHVDIVLLDQLMNLTG